jgi:pimeloyl-ACP methyl ester carboxylesterase
MIEESSALDKRASLKAEKSSQNKAVSESDIGFFNRFVLSRFYPLSGAEKTEYMLRCEEILLQENKFQMEEIPVTIDGVTRTLEAFSKKSSLSNGETVVLFHANGMSGAEMHRQALFYLDLGYDVLLPTVGGYPGSPGVATCEASLYQDVEAIKCFLYQNGIRTVGYHGLSLGGALALQAAIYKNENAPLNTKFVVGDQTFTQGVEAAVNLTKNMKLGLFDTFVEKRVSTALKVGEEVVVEEGRTIFTDGFDNKKKVANLKLAGIPLIFIEAGKDEHMGIGRKRAGTYARTMSTVLHESASLLTSSVEEKSFLFRMEGEKHCASFTEDTAVEKGLWKAIVELPSGEHPEAKGEVVCL